MQKKYPVLITISHSTNYLPEKIGEKMQLNKNDISRYYDGGSYELYNLNNFHVITSKYSRLYCDLNRDPKQRSGFTMKNRKGVIINKTYWGKDIYKKPLIKDEYSSRLKEHSRFFAEVKKAIKDKNIRFFISGHTMRSYPPQGKPTDANERKQIVLSNNDHQTCDEKTINIMKECFIEQGYTVEINDPFKGGYLLTHFCDKKALPGIQIEFKIANIGDEKNLKLDRQKIKIHKEKIEKTLSDFYMRISSHSKV